MKQTGNISQAEHDAFIDEMREIWLKQFSTEQRDLIKRCKAFDPAKMQSFKAFDPAKMQRFLDLIMTVAKMARLLDQAYILGHLHAGENDV